MASPADPSDSELLRRAASIDPPSLAILYDRHAPACYALAHRMLGPGERAEGAVQQAFVHLWQSGSSFDATRGSVRSQLLAHVHALSRDALRAQPRDAARPDESAPVGGLPAELWAVLELAYFGGLTETEVAHRLDVSVDDVKARMRRALEQLRAGTQDTSAS
jgi:RNA polymerase sigma-70 factor (ECF subfamily)